VRDEWLHRHFSTNALVIAEALAIPRILANDLCESPRRRLDYRHFAVRTKPLARQTLRVLVGRGVLFDRLHSRCRRVFFGAMLHIWSSGVACLFRLCARGQAPGNCSARTFWRPRRGVRRGFRAGPLRGFVSASNSYSRSGKTLPRKYVDPVQLLAGASCIFGAERG
jgi:hypothetical protein